MRTRFLKDGLGWGFVLWAIGYPLGIMLFAFVPANLIGWIIMPFGTAITFWITLTKVRGETLRYFGLVGLVWLLMAVGGDYMFIVKAFQPADGYYKLDVYLYYALTLAIPLIVGWRKNADSASPCSPPQIASHDRFVDRRHHRGGIVYSNRDGSGSVLTASVCFFQEHRGA